jgi:hypothetical protein
MTHLLLTADDRTEDANILGVVRCNDLPDGGPI